ncbi:MAG: 4-hydroxy-tetrahydrodipicolinate synthase, partial [Schleiferiaceae bacterium]|nr:4-hydroxy-tetrahydrodipicolinate synthase [Schleiferiaceae bacterium]
LNAQEKNEVTQTIIEATDGRVPGVLGIGGNDTQSIIDSIQSANLEGIEAILSVSPYYNKPTQEGIYQHYKALAKVSPNPIIVYNVPGRTSSNVTAATTLRLANDFEKIAAVKEASGDLTQIMEIVNNRPEGFLVLSGDDNLTFPMLALGCDGVISVSGQAFPRIFSGMVRDALNGFIEKARPAHYELFHFTNLLFAEGNPGGIKASLKVLGVCDDHLRLPLWPISEELYSQIENEVKRIQ